MADIVEGNGFPLDGKKDVVDASAAAIEHLPEGDAELLRRILGDGVVLRHRGQFGDGLLQAVVPTGGSVG
jgi:hypothetical protein